MPGTLFLFSLLSTGLFSLILHPQQLSFTHSKGKEKGKKQATAISPKLFQLLFRLLSHLLLPSHLSIASFAALTCVSPCPISRTSPSPSVAVPDSVLCPCSFQNNCFGGQLRTVSPRGRQTFRQQLSKLFSLVRRRRGWRLKLRAQ